MRPDLAKSMSHTPSCASIRTLERFRSPCWCISNGRQLLSHDGGDWCNWLRSLVSGSHVALVTSPTRRSSWMKLVR
eukprot:7206220-Prymnesium_polylepis.2